MAADPAVRDAALLSIGEVLAQLRAEFPDTTISKLRFLETEGLVQPQRTASGYRKYSREDVARLRFVLATQRDQYLPLRVIRQQLAEGMHLPPARPALMAVPSLEPDYEPAPVAGNRFKRAELCERAQIGEQMLADLEKHGLISATAGGWFDADALAVAEVAGMLAAYGIEPRHLRAYRVAADREAGLLAQVVTPLQRQAIGKADEAIRELILLSQRLHLALLRSALGETLGP